MASTSKSFSLLLIVLLAASSLIMAKPAFAQTPTPTPSPITLPLPEFTVTLTNASYYSPTTYYTDPQTGANITVAGTFVNLENLTFTFQNQPDVTFYAIQWTTPYMTSWNFIYGHYDGRGMNATLELSLGSTTTWALSGTCGTFLLYGENSNQSTVVNGYTFANSEINLNFESGATVEFQAQAIYGIAHYADPYPYFDEEQYYINGEVSDWSRNQTVTIPANTPLSPTPAPSSPTSTPMSVSSALNSSLLLITTTAVVVIAFLLAVIIFLLLYMRKRKPINLSQ